MFLMLFHTSMLRLLQIPPPGPPFSALVTPQFPASFPTKPQEDLGPHGRGTRPGRPSGGHFCLQASVLCLRGCLLLNHKLFEDKDYSLSFLCPQGLAQGMACSGDTYMFTGCLDELGSVLGSTKTVRLWQEREEGRGGGPSPKRPFGSLTVGSVLTALAAHHALHSHQGKGSLGFPVLPFMMATSLRLFDLACSGVRGCSRVSELSDT